MSNGASVAEVNRKIGVTDITFYRGRKLYGGVQVSETKRLKEVEKENSRLRKRVADLSGSLEGRPAWIYKCFTFSRIKPRSICLSISLKR